MELELDPPPDPELDELEEMEELEELDEEAEELELALDETLLLPVDEPALDPPGPVKVESAPHPARGATPASAAPPERMRRKSRRSSIDDCFER